MPQSVGSELDTTQGLNNNKYFYKIILLLSYTLSHIPVLFIHCVALTAPSTLCFLCLNGCLWPLGDPVEPPHSIFVCVCLPHCTAYGILVPWPGIKPRSSAAKALSPNHWTTREFPSQSLYSQRQPGIQQIELNRCWPKKLTVLTVDPERNS